jgi:hypothetical protein
MGAAIAEGANAVALREVKAENDHLKAVNGVRALADEKRWNKTRKKLARKYTVKPAGRARGAILLVWALSWMVVFECFRRLQAINREM